MTPTNDALDTGSTAATSLRRLAHETRALERPSDSYEVIGDLLSGVRSLQQVLNQLARQHRDLQMTVRDDAGNALAGRTAAVTAMDKLRQAAGMLELVETRLDQASQASGRIVWPASIPARSTQDFAGHVRTLDPQHDHGAVALLPVVEMGR